MVRFFGEPTVDMVTQMKEDADKLIENSITSPHQLKNIYLLAGIY